MRPVIRTLASNSEVISLAHYGVKGCGIHVSGAATCKALANREDLTTVIQTVVLTAGGGLIDFPAHALLFEAGQGQKVTLIQYGD